MRVAVLTTGTNNTKPIYEPLRALGHDLTTIIYDAMNDHVALPVMVDAINPDWVLLIGAIEAHHGKPVPKVDVLGKIGERHLLIHLCCDGGEPAWWQQLQSYYDDGNFALQVNIDGVRIGPIGDRGLVMLCPIDAAQFPNPPRPWDDRPISLGFGGGVTAIRAPSISDLQRRGLLTHRPRDDGGYDGYREFLCSCRCTLNNALTGGGTGLMHVKARVIEAALAGSLVLEQEGSPAADWFEPGVDYLTYGNADDVAQRLDWVSTNSAEAETMALRLRSKVMAEHSPAMFWGRVLEYLGFEQPVMPVRNIPFNHWSINAVPRPILSIPGSPRFVHDIYGHNIVAYGPYFYVIPQKIGSIHLEVEVERAHPKIRRADTIERADRMAIGD